MAAHRYWRLYITATVGGGLAAIDEVEFLGIVNGALLAPTGVAISSSEFNASWIDDQAFNRAGGSWASLNTAPPHWIGYDFGISKSYDIVSVALTVSGSDTSWMASSFNVQYSDNGSTWTTAWSVSGATGWGIAERRAFTNGTGLPSVSKQAWRIKVTNTHAFSTVMEVASLQWRTSVGGADQASGGFPFQSSFHTYALQADKAYDGNSTTYWRNAPSEGNTSGVIGYGFSSAKNIVELVMTARSDNANGAPKTFTVEYWDGSAWIVTNTYTASAWAVGETKIFSVSGGGAPTGDSVQRYIVNG